MTHTGSVSTDALGIVPVLASAVTVPGATPLRLTGTVLPESNPTLVGRHTNTDAHDATCELDTRHVHQEHFRAHVQPNTRPLRRSERLGSRSRVPPPPRKVGTVRRRSRRLQTRTSSASGTRTKSRSIRTTKPSSRRTPCPPPSLTTAPRTCVTEKPMIPWIKVVPHVPQSHLDRHSPAGKPTAHNPVATSEVSTTASLSTIFRHTVPETAKLAGAQDTTSPSVSTSTSQPNPFGSVSAPTLRTESPPTPPCVSATTHPDTIQSSIHTNDSVELSSVAHPSVHRASPPTAVDPTDTPPPCAFTQSLGRAGFAILRPVDHGVALRLPLPQSCTQRAVAFRARQFRFGDGRYGTATILPIQPHPAPFVQRNRSCRSVPVRAEILPLPSRIPTPGLSSRPRSLEPGPVPVVEAMQVSVPTRHRPQRRHSVTAYNLEIPRDWGTYQGSLPIVDFEDSRDGMEAIIHGHEFKPIRAPDGPFHNELHGRVPLSASEVRRITPDPISPIAFPRTVVANDSAETAILEHLELVMDTSSVATIDHLSYGSREDQMQLSREDMEVFLTPAVNAPFPVAEIDCGRWVDTATDAEATEFLAGLMVDDPEASLSLATTVPPFPDAVSFPEPLSAAVSESESHNVRTHPSTQPIVKENVDTLSTPI